MIHLKKIITYIFVLCCLFPYTPPLLSTDSQPVALILSLLLLPIYANRKSLKQKGFALFILVLLFAVITLIYSPWNINSVRSLSNYVSLFTVSFVTYRILPTLSDLKLFRLFKIAVYIWFFVGAIQTFIYPDFLSFLVPRGSAFMSGRGVSCLAPEPTFYAIICSCFLIINRICNMHSKGDGLRWLLWIQIILFARSATIIFIITASYFLYLLLRRGKLRNIAIAGIAGYIFISCIKFIGPYIVSFRAGNLLLSLIENPTLFIVADASVNERFIHAFFPIYGWLKNYGLPYGYGYFNDFMHEIYNQGHFNEYLLYYRDNYTRIMSSFGSAVFELGCIGLIIPYVLIRNILKLVKQNSIFIFYGSLFFCILLNAMPLNCAIVGFTFGNIIYAAKHNALIREERERGCK